MDPQGVVLIGEASMAYVRYKYVELFLAWGFVAVIIIVVVACFYALIKSKD